MRGFSLSGVVEVTVMVAEDFRAIARTPAADAVAELVLLILPAFLRGVFVGHKAVILALAPSARQAYNL